MKKSGNRTKKVLKYLLSAAVAAVLLYFSFKGVKWSNFISGLQSCRWEFVLLSMGAGILAFYLRGLRWRRILLPIDNSISRLVTFNAINIGNAANFVFPRIGEFVRCGFITRNSAPEEGSEDSSGDGRQHFPKRKASYDKVLGTVVLERSWDLLSMVILLVVLLVFKWADFGDFFVQQMWRPFEKAVHFSLWWAILAAVLLCAIAIWRMVRTRDTSPLSGKIYGVFRGLWQGVFSCLKMERKWLFFLYTALIWGLYWFMSVSIMWAVPDLAGLGMVDCLFLMMAGSFGWLVPVPGGFGAFHFIVSLALETIYGIPFELGIVFATLSHESQAITMALFGGGSYLYESLKK